MRRGVDVAQFRDLTAKPGFDLDNTEAVAEQWIGGYGARFYRGKPRKKKGRESITFANSAALSGSCRMVYSHTRSGRLWYALGTHTRLYALTGTQLTNITPLVTSTTNLGSNPLTTYFPTLGNNPLTTVDGSKDITVTHANHRFVAGDSVTLAGASTTNGIPDTEINALHTIRSVVANTSYVITVATTAATSSASGGGASVTVASGLITVADTAHGFSNGDRIKLLAATTTRGITDTLINIEHIIRNKATDAYDIMTTGTSTSGGTGGGTAPITRQGQIAAGNEDGSTGQGYSAGQYSDDEYSAALQSSTALVPPRIWQGIRYGSNMLLFPGDGGLLYQWDAATAVAPAKVTNSPSNVDGAFVIRNIVVTYYGNVMTWNNVAQLTVWASTETNYAGARTLYSADDIISDAKENDDTQILFTESQAYIWRWIDLPDVFSDEQLPVTDGIIAKSARITVNGVVFWMGNKNFYMASGGAVRVIPNNTILTDIFSDIDPVQKFKIFVEMVRENGINELRWHIPTIGSSEPDICACVDLNDFTWWTDTSDLTASEYPYHLSANHLNVDSDGTLYRAEKGVNDDGSALPFRIEGPWNSPGKRATELKALYPDSIQTGNLTVTLKTRRYLQDSDSEQSVSRTVTSTTERIEPNIDGRYWKWIIEQSEVDGDWAMGKWQELIEEGASLE